jgi:serine/threonine protein kinase
LHKKKANLSDAEKKKIVLQIISVFYYLHKHGIVHRDIKSHNILLDKSYNVKLCDFGLARHKVTLLLIQSELNQGPMQFSGTPTYMAQELFLKKAYDESVDIFALGTLFYEIYYG